MLNQFLQKLDLSEKESRLYISLLKLGQNPASILAKQTGMSRTTAYSCLQQLEKKEFVMAYQKNNLRIFAARPPETIKQILDQKVREANVNKLQFEKFIPSFKAIMTKSGALPKVDYFEGVDGLEKIYQHHLEQNLNKLSYSPAESIEDKDLKVIINNYLKERVGLKLQARAIFPVKESTKKIKEQDQKNYRISKLIDEKKFPFSSEINIYGDFISFITLKGRYHGFIIESAEIAQTQRSIFELAWMAAS